MKNAKKVISFLTAAALAAGNLLAVSPQIVKAAPGNIGGEQIIYKAFGSGTMTDDEFGIKGTDNVDGSLNSSVSPRVIQLKYQGQGGIGNAEDNGKMYATFECNRLPKEDAALVAEAQGNDGSNVDPYSSVFPIYESLDNGLTWGDPDHMVARGNNYLPIGYVQDQGAPGGEKDGVTYAEPQGMRNCPQLYEMPETVGELEKGTILCAGNATDTINVMKGEVTYLDLCVSTDLGRTWNYQSRILGPIPGKCRLNYDTVWEPFFITHNGTLYCFYSDESIDSTNAQDIAYVYTTDGVNWSERHRVIYTAGKRPGMPVVSQLKDGRFMLTYERDGGSTSGYILSEVNDPTKWYAADGTLKDTMNGEWVNWNDGTYVTNGGSPYNLVTSDGTILYNNQGTGSGDLLVNSSKNPKEDGASWIRIKGGFTADAYNRQILELNDGSIFIISGWNNTGIKCTTLDYRLNLGYLESKIGWSGQKIYAAVDAGSKDEGARLITWTGPETNQCWDLQEAEDGAYYLMNTQSGRVISPSTSNSGSKLVQKAKTGQDKNQMWIFEAAEDGYYMIKNAGTGLYLTTLRKSVTDGRLMELVLSEASAENRDSQLWKTGMDVQKAQTEHVFDIFEDVQEDDWFTNAIQYVYDYGIMTGTDETHFKPDMELTRSHFAVILYRMENEPDVTYETVFPDVADGQYYTNAVMWANSKETEIITGYKGGVNSGNFGPDDNITREQLATMLYRYAKYKGYDTSKASDMEDFLDKGEISAFAEEAMSWAVAENLLKGSNGKLNPQSNANRAECAEVIQRFMENIVR